MKVTLIAIAGGSGSGKTWLARELQHRLEPLAAILSLDDFYADLSHLVPSERAARNFDDPEAIDWALFQQCLEGILRGHPVWLPQYDFTTHTRKSRPRRWPPKPVVLVEGLWPWRHARLRALYALKVFRAETEETRFNRRLARDIEKRGRTPDSVRQQWSGQVQPMYARFIHPQMRSADVTLSANIPEWRLVRLTQKIQRFAEG
ncbi:MAG: uridine kinase [Verrucomicrobiota bacterium]